MKIAVILIIPFLYGLYEIYGVFKGLDEKTYIYGDYKHSVEHFVYLVSYIMSLLLLALYLYTKDEIICNYFIISLTFSSMTLIRHIHKERISTK